MDSIASVPVGQCLPEAKIVEYTRLANEEHRLCESSAPDAVQHAAAAGQYLLEVKNLIYHGDWQVWLKHRFKGSPRTTRAYIRLARELPKLPPQNGNAVAVLSLRKALASVADSSRRIAKYDTDDQKRILRAWEKHNLSNSHQAVCRAERELIEAENRQPKTEAVDGRHGTVAAVASDPIDDPASTQEPFGQILRNTIQNLWNAHPEVPAVALADLLTDMAKEVMEAGDR